MNRDYASSSKTSRSISAVVASIFTVAILAGITLLADHYHETSPTMAATQQAARG